MARVRLGVALLLPSPVDGAVDALRLACGDGALTRLPAHCTLVPPVNVRDEHLVDAIDVVRTAAAATRPFTVELGPPATFWPVNPVLYLPVTGSSIDALHALRDRVFTAPLARTLSWPFVAHVTLADDIDADRIPAALAALRDYRTEVTFDRVHVLQEGPGRVWRPIADAVFAAPAVVGRGGLPLELSVSDDPDVEGRAFSAREWPVHQAALHGASVRWDLDNFAVTARRDGRVVGVASGWTHSAVGFLDELLVAAEHRGEGVGSHLLASFESLAGERDCDRLALRAWAGTPAEAFYLARGWREEARFSPWRYGRDLVQLRRDLRS